MLLASEAPAWDPEAGVDTGGSAPVEILEVMEGSLLLFALLRLWLENRDLFLMCRAGHKKAGLNPFEITL